MTPAGRALASLALVLCVAGTTGCKSEKLCGGEAGARDALADQPVDPRLMAFLSRARAAHHEADLHEGDLEKSLGPLIALVDGPVPTGNQETPIEVREVLADTYARIADLESQRQRFDEADKRVTRALEWVQPVSYFRGHLLETRGLIAERRAAQLAQSGELEASKRSKLSAIEAFEQAMEVQAQVIRAAGGNTPSSTPSSSSPLQPTSPTP